MAKEFPTLGSLHLTISFVVIIVDLVNKIIVADIRLIAIIVKPLPHSYLFI